MMMNDDDDVMEVVVVVKNWRVGERERDRRRDHGSSPLACNFPKPDNWLYSP